MPVKLKMDASEIGNALASISNSIAVHFEVYNNHMYFNHLPTPPISVRNTSDLLSFCIFLRYAEKPPPTASKTASRQSVYGKGGKAGQAEESPVRAVCTPSHFISYFSFYKGSISFRPQLPKIIPLCIPPPFSPSFNKVASHFSDKLEKFCTFAAYYTN